MSMATPDVRPPDLEMRVTTSERGGQLRLIYTLHSATGKASFVHREVLGPVLLGGPRELQENLLVKIERLARLADVNDSPLEQDEVERKLANLGRDLWRELFPVELRQAYRQFRRHVESWEILSDETWIPWELVKPYDDSLSDALIDDDFLAHRFKLTRWLAGEKSPLQRLQVASLAVLETAADLPLSGCERTLVSEVLRGDSGVEERSPVLRSSRDALDFLNGEGAALLHFIGHGERDTLRPNEAGLSFPDGSALRPQDLGGPLASCLGRSRPFVFLNACWAGQQGPSFARLGGWAPRWVEVCGAGAFVAPLWPVRDDTACSFARWFYSALSQGATLGEAALQARRTVYRERPGDASALAYTVYGHPNARVVLGAAETLEQPGPGTYRSQQGLPPDLVPRPLSAEASRLERARRPRPLLVPAARRRSAILSLILAILVVSSLRGSFLLSALAGRQVSGTLLSNPLAYPVEIGQHGPGPSPVELLWRRRHGSSELPTGRNGKGTASGGGRERSLAGNPLHLTMAPGVVRDSLDAALDAAANALSEAGIQGWTLDVEVEPPQITDLQEFGAAWKQCRLAARGRARRTAASVDFGRVFVDNLQSDADQACTRAAGDLALLIIKGIVTATRKEKQ